MSCYVVNNHTITAIVEGLDRYNVRVGDMSPRTGKGYGDIARALLALNVESVNERYNEDNAAPAWRREFLTKDGGEVLGRVRRDYTLAEIFGAVQCYEYQSCEAPGYLETDIHAALRLLKDRIAEEALTGERHGFCHWEIHPED